ncbi:EG45-like domain containing protein 2 [Acorus gramineus]|uniref:EG45-like domain containing protein 2 n=1 Tax=Acorus gramineus TaxID=55184 RepID=A0AAV8ZZL5_ACOGR|nr:EG45-like domain containing protein 2 [Acorus gramineus]
MISTMRAQYKYRNGFLKERGKTDQNMRLTVKKNIVFIALACTMIDRLIVVKGDLGTATSYDPPYLPTKCPGYNQNNFPGGGLFAAASYGIWDNGAACGRKYRVRCLSGLNRPCKDGTIMVEVVDFCRSSPCPSTMVLSNKAFSALSKILNSKINIEYAQV